MSEHTPIPLEEEGIVPKFQESIEAQIPREQDFVIRPLSAVHSPQFYEQQEMIEYYRDSEILQDLIQRAYKRPQSLTPEEVNEFSSLQHDWWKEVYLPEWESGDSFSQEERFSVLQRKYDPPVLDKERAGLQGDFLYALKSRDESLLQSLHEEYLSRYPTQHEGVEVIFGLARHIEEGRRLEEGGFEQKADKLQMIESRAQYHYLLTHYLAMHSEEKEHLATLWNIMELATSQLPPRPSDAVHERNRHYGARTEFNQLRKGVLSQVATWHLFRGLGYDAQLAHPAQDAFRATDLWATEDTVVQVKGTPHALEFEEVETIGFPAVSLMHDDGSEEYIETNTHLSESLTNFRMNLKSYGKKIEKNLKGYVVYIPYQEFDQITGIPSENILQEIGERLHVDIQVVRDRAESRGYVPEMDVGTHRSAVSTIATRPKEIS